MSSTKPKTNNINCCVYGCHSRGSKNQNLSFHGFPKSGERKVVHVNDRGISELVDKRKVWILKIRTGKPVTTHMKICSLHFKKEDFILPDIPTKRKVLKRNAVPSQNLPLGSIPKLQRTRINKRRQCDSDPEQTHEADLNTSTSTSITNILDQEVDPNTTTPVSNILEDLPSTSAYLLCEVTIEDIAAAHILLDLKNSKPKPTSVSVGTQVTSGDIFQSFISLIDSDSKLNTLTGLSNFKMLESIEFCFEKIFSSKKLRTTSVRERIILTLIKLKQNFSFQVLSILFKSLTPATCKNIFSDTLKKLSLILEVCIYWPSKQECLDNMPVIFKDFQNVRVVLDCTEVRMQKPKCLCCRLKSYSHYKSHNTIKFLCGVSPAGLITFVSKGYGGRTSDKSIFEQSKLIEKLNPYEDAIMIDKGFRIDEVAGSYGIKLVRPPFLRKNNPLSKNDVKLTCKIAQARVHVERVFQRVKIFNILSQPITWNMLTKIDQIIIVCCAITNLSSPVLGDDKFLK